MQLISGAQFLNICFCSSVCNFYPLTCMYASLYSRKFHFIIEVLNSIWLFTLHVLRDPSFISTQCLVLNLDGSFRVSSNKLLFFHIPWLYYYINLRLLIICCLFSGDINNIFLSISSFISEFGNVFETFVILSTTFLPIKSPGASSVFWISLFEAVF